MSESDDPRARESHFDHRFSNSFREGGNIPPLWARSIGSDVRCVGLHWLDHKQVLIARGDSNIRTVQDLRGARFGLPRRRNDQIDFWAAAGLRLLYSELDAEGIDRNDVEIVDLDVNDKYLANIGTTHGGGLWTSLSRFAFQTAETIALGSGQVDATFSMDFRAVELINMLGALVVTPSKIHRHESEHGSYINPVALTVSGELCDERPDLVARYLRSTIKAANWASNHRSETISLLAREVIAAEEVVGRAYAHDFHERLTPQLGAEIVSALDVQKAFLHENGFIANDFDIDDFIDTRPLALAMQQDTREQ